MRISDWSSDVCSSDLARAARVVAITGSNGKTSVKALVLSILQRAGSAYGNPGNRNNEIGLPLAVIDAPDDADFAVYEMGAGKPGDIAYLTAVRSEEHTSELQSLMRNSYAVFWLQNKQIKSIQ